MRFFLAILIALSAVVYAGTTPEGLKFLYENKDKEGVITLASGLQYKVLSSGPGDGPSPLVNTPCDCHYEGKFIDGKVFDSSYARGQPTKFAPNQVIKGWTEAMQLMRQGDKWEMYIPSELAYGDRGGMIPAGAVLIFTMEIVKVHETPKPKTEL
ncbi:FKBP-type peptidyl-prolyl cis-trans isomerase FklB [Sphaeroforma arctica JP610]|uniref:peptidylprolyl isomerase n=1 Tax=Sphaeroforma arctica JP610 TaxID=667725 RepID=A0A0L0GA71_9EUKA|nr:FKBP-type peptidyl-prolyl cis-trans isomerase FklB [Sphaeroforma arctica JP610]KNC85138.1 FKBP-type peptidyl-prolyl cis-trans isomerase FklB [Sphaeroforma arctica JP610]|eukprot:XP_014159040.1 FKBP-type peptidyl-prolyl cis-trans isomerase FklB [Sphaeroforma arctica JP610]